MAATGSLTSLRQLNRLRVVDALRERGRLSRADIARSTGLSRSTVTSLVADLTADGIVVESADVAAAAPLGQGRPPILLQLDPTAGVAVGVDFDHDHVLVVVADLAREVLAERAAPADVDHDAAGALDCAAELIAAALADVAPEPRRVLGVGVAMAGPVDQRAGRVSGARILPGWAGLDVAVELTARLGVPVHVDNDANLAALAEVTQGAAQDAVTAVYLQLSSGVGAGLIVEGRPFRGAAGVAGEIGHYAVDPAGPLCRCGSRGCLETLASGPALAALVSASRPGPPLTTAQIVELALGGDLGARRVLADGADIVGRAVGNVCNVLNPDTLVVGGLLGSAGDLYLEPLREGLDRVALPEVREGLRIVAGALDHRATALGALALAIARSDDAVADLVAVPAGNGDR